MAFKILLSSKLFITEKLNLCQYVKIRPSIINISGIILQEIACVLIEQSKFEEAVEYIEDSFNLFHYMVDNYSK